jgi:hypothetical protein
MVIICLQHFEVSRLQRAATVIGLFLVGRIVVFVHSADFRKSIGGRFDLRRMSF